MIDRRDRRRRRNRPIPEVLEDRRLLASLAAINNLTVPAQQGYVQVLDGSGTTDPQVFTITRISGSPDITASIPQAMFWTINIQYTDPSNAANDFSGPLVFQLFPGLTPNTVSEIETFTNDGYYTGKDFMRIAGGFPGANDDILQAGAVNPDGSGGLSGQPNTPFLNENLQQLAFTGTYQLAMANAGVNSSLPGASEGVNTDDTQFFITTTGSPNSGLGYGYTIFGQMLAGQSTLTKMTQVPLAYSSVYDATVTPTNPIIMSSLSLSTTDPSGVALIDTTQARPGDTATFQVTAIDPTDGSTVSRTFTVTAGSYGGPTYPAIDFKPLADPGTATVADGSSTTVTLTGQDGYPGAASGYGGTLSYSLVSQPSHGTVSDFNATNGTFVYTPQPGYSGPDSIQYEVQEDGPAPPTSTDYSTFGPAVTTTSAPATVSINVTPAAPQATPTITWADPADITYGTALSGAQLDARASVPGTFVYSPAPDTVLNAGLGQTLTVTFTPNDTTDYTATSASVTINVGKATPAINWTNPAGIVYGTALSSAQLDATSPVQGGFVYTPAAGTVLQGGAGQTLSVAFTPTDLADYLPTTAQTTINVARVVPSITWSDPAGIVYGTPLSGTQLDARASVPGTFVYSPAPNTVLNAGAGQTLTVTFTPTDLADYAPTTATVTIDVAKATPTIAWSDPAGLTAGTALGPAQLDATSPVAGTFVYTPAAGTVLQAGSGQTLSVLFTPTDAADYNTATASVAINVAAPAPVGTPTVLGSLTGVDDLTNAKHQITSVTLTFDGSVDSGAAGSKATYTLIQQGKHGTFNLKRGPKIKIKAASYDPSSQTVRLIPRKPIASSKPVEVLIGGKVVGTA